eukprot:scaffold59330_cov18-Tisochrysis_lutea.AAC.1
MFQHAGLGVGDAPANKHISESVCALAQAKMCTCASKHVHLRMQTCVPVQASMCTCAGKHVHLRRQACAPAQHLDAGRGAREEPRQACPMKLPMVLDVCLRGTSAKEQIRYLLPWHTYTCVRLLPACAPSRELI